MLLRQDITGGMVTVQTNSIVNTQEIKKRLKEILEILMVNEVTKPLTPQKLKAILTALGPQFIELGRIMAEHNDILPRDYHDELYNPMPTKNSINYNKLEAIIENEYGASMEDVFIDFSKNPIYQSPLFQCHRAILKDGPQVIVKIQEPRLKNHISEDTDLIKKALGVLRISPSEPNSIDLNMIFDELWNIAQKELNFFVEADNATRFYKLNSGEKYVISPKVDNKYNTSNILVMEYIPGTPLNNNEELVLNGYQLPDISKILAENYVKQIFIDGFFQPYPDSKNILFYKSNIVWTNFTLMGELSSYNLDTLKSIAESISLGNIEKVSSVIMSINTNDAVNNVEELKNGLQQILSPSAILYRNAQPLPITSIIKSLVTLLNNLDIYLPESFSHLLSGLISIENIVEKLDPNNKLTNIIKNVILPPTEEMTPKQENNILNKNNNIIQPPVNINAEPENISDISDMSENSETQNTQIPDINTLSREELLAPLTDKKNEIEELKQDTSKSEAKHYQDLEQSLRKSLEKNNKLDEQNKTPDLNKDKQIKSAQPTENLKYNSSDKSRVDFKLRVDDSSIKSLTKTTNNLLICLIALSFFIGSCFVLSLDNPVFIVFGLPAISVLFFTISIILILWLVVRIIRK